MLYNSGKVKDLDGGCPILISRYSFGDHPNDFNEDIVSDLVGGHNASVLGKVTKTADAVSDVANIVAADSQGYFVMNLYSIPELRSYTSMVGTAMGQADSYSGT